MVSPGLDRAIYRKYRHKRFDLRPWLLSLDVPMTKEKREEIKIRQVVEKREMVRVSVKKGSSTKSVSIPQLFV